MVVNSHDLMPDDMIAVHCADGGTDLLVVTCVHWERDAVTVTGYSPWFGEGNRTLTLPFNDEMELWNA